MAHASKLPNEMSVEELAQQIASGNVRDARLLGLDLGTKTIGIAVSDAGFSIATPHLTIRRTKFTKDAEALIALIEAEKALAIVLGLPMNMDGSEGPRAQATRAFARNLTAKVDIPLVYWDERLSTVAAERSMLEGDLSRRKRERIVDQVAASFILQGCLDRLTAIRRNG